MFYPKIKTMLKSSVPVYFCGIAFIIAMPTMANPGLPALEPGNSIYYTTAPAPVPPKKNHISFSLPDKKGIGFVRSYLKHNDEDLHVIRQRSEGPFSIIDSVLTRYHLPLELKYLAVIESDLKPTAVSRVGAKGPWQLMPGTAHVLGLKVNHKSDERKDYYKSTRAAAKYLCDLHREFGDWLLVLAAYNGGPVPVIRAIRKAHSRNFWALEQYLPAESRQHVKRFIATAYYFRSAETGATIADLNKNDAFFASTVKK